jgi:phage I-like protein
MKEKGFDIAAGKQGGGAPDTSSLTPEEMETAKRANMTPEEYMKNK